jgi:2-keto-4-pentenoate hydratase/2-oxohepta-3-ene-1,7-dioic acid hydratase in catechol pathway
MSHLRFVSFEVKGASGYGLWTDTGIIASDREKWPTLQSVVEAAALAELGRDLQHKDVCHQHSDVSLCIPIRKPGKIICVGVNFPDRNEEYKDGQAAPENPSLFMRLTSSFVGHNQALIRPPESHQLDYEGEIAIIVGRAGRRIPERTALDHIAALTLCNDGTLRDWVGHAKFNVTQGKNFERSGALGPWLVPFTDEKQIADIRLTTRVNGELRQNDRTSRMIFSFRKIINYISTFTTLEPGDVIVTGTPPGAGARLDPPQWLKPGDVVEVEAEGLGLLRNTVSDEA